MLASDDNLAGVGADLRALRQRRGLSLTRVAKDIERSVGYLSQIERGISEPSIADLKKLAAQFGVPLSSLFRNDEGDPAEREHIVRGDARRRLGTSTSGLVEELLSPNLGGHFEIVRSVFSPGSSKPDAERRESEEAGYVVSGRLDLEIDGHWHALRPGDSFRFFGEPYRWRNPGRQEAVVIWVIAPPIY